MAVAAVLFRHEYEREFTYDWYNDLARYVRSVNSHPLNIVTFNYDRSLEHHVSQLLSGVAGQPNIMSPAVCFRRHINIHHIYGSLPPLPTFRLLTEREFQYGDFSGHSAWEAGLEIFKFCHDEADPEKVATCRSLVRASDVILILGFGFDHINMTRLGLHDENESQLIISSGYKLNAEI